jgi:hypothetical protein
MTIDHTTFDTLVAYESATPGRGIPIRITAGVDARRDLCVIIVSAGRWSIFDSDSPNSEWLGEIERRGARFVARHDDGPTPYTFERFADAMSYFMEYGFALSLGRHS